MSDLRLIDAVKSGDFSAIESLLRSDTDVNQQDENGWTPLNWAAGKGDTTIINLLLNKGADVFKVGRDQRTPYMISLAAGHVEAVKLLSEAEEKVGDGRSSRTERKYCKAYELHDLRLFPGWSESKINWKQEQEGDEAEEDKGFSDDDIVFIHQDFTVTISMWHGENIIFDQVTPEWKEFCATALNFKTPDDLDLIRASNAESAAAD